MNDATSNIRHAWNQQAQRWYDQRESILAASRPVHQWLVRHADPGPGQRLLEIAAGPGDTGFLAAPLLEHGRLVSTDLAPAMVEAARRRGAEFGITNADFRVLDAQAMDLADASFDRAICRWGYMLMPDPAAALRETWRVLKPGGRLALAVFAGPADNPWVSIPAQVLREAGHLPSPPLSADWQPGILALADRAQLQALIESAGFTSPAIEPIAMAWTFVNADDYWAFLEEAAALGQIIRGLPAADRSAIRGAIEARVAPFTSEAGVVLPAKCWGAVAIR